MAFTAREIDPKYRIDPKKASQKDLEEALALLARKREKADRIKRGELKGSYGVPWSEMTKEQKERALKYARRRAIRLSLLVAKAADQGIVVTDKEVDAEIARRQGKK